VHIETTYDLVDLPEALVRYVLDWFAEDRAIVERNRAQPCTSLRLTAREAVDAAQELARSGADEWTGCFVAQVGAARLAAGHERIDPFTGVPDFMAALDSAYTEIRKAAQRLREESAADESRHLVGGAIVVEIVWNQLQNAYFDSYCSYFDGDGGGPEALWDDTLRLMEKCADSE
jgi:AcrR family transcriptional regulator